MGVGGQSGYTGTCCEGQSKQGGGIGIRIEPCSSHYQDATIMCEAIPTANLAVPDENQDVVDVVDVDGVALGLAHPHSDEKSKADGRGWGRPNGGSVGPSAAGGVQPPVRGANSAGSGPARGRPTGGNRAGRVQKMIVSHQ